MDNITLIGMPGSGKSTVGVLLAKALGYGFVDTDLLLQQREGAVLQELLDRRGLDYFLRAEEAAVCAVDCRRCVIAPGGSVVYSRRAMEHLGALGDIVYLHLGLDELKHRIRNISTRGIAMRPGESLESVYACRAPLYERYARRTVDCRGQSLEQTVRAVLACLRG